MWAGIVVAVRCHKAMTKVQLILLNRYEERRWEEDGVSVIPCRGHCVIVIVVVVIAFPVDPGVGGTAAPLG